MLSHTAQVHIAINLTLARFPLKHQAGAIGGVSSIWESIINRCDGSESFLARDERHPSPPFFPVSHHSSSLLIVKTSITQQ